MQITTHVLDTTLGKGASHVGVILESLFNLLKPELIKEAFTNNDGKILPFLYDNPKSAPGLYRLSFKTKEYFSQTNRQCFYPIIVINFYCLQPNEHYHIPVLLSNFGYSTYRGS